MALKWRGRLAFRQESGEKTGAWLKKTGDVLSNIPIFCDALLYNLGDCGSGGAAAAGRSAAASLERRSARARIKIVLGTHFLQGSSCAAKADFATEPCASCVQQLGMWVV